MSSRFTLPITPAAADIDELGHVSNQVYLRWVLEIATSHSSSLGWGHAEYRTLGSVFVVRRHEIDYIAQVREGEQLVGETWVPSWKLASCVRMTEIKRGEQIVAKAATTWAMMSFSTGRPTKIPDHLRELFTRS